LAFVIVLVFATETAYKIWKQRDVMFNDGLRKEYERGEEARRRELEAGEAKANQRKEAVREKL